MEYILLIETGTDVCSVAIAEGESVVASRESFKGREHAQNIALYVEEVLSELGITCSDLSAVALGIGPGSYTGLRIGSSFAKGICYSQGIPLIGISSLHAMCEGYLMGSDSESFNSNSVLAPMIDARRMEVFTQLFDGAGEPITDISAEIIDEDSFGEYRDRDFVIFGNGADKCRDILNVSSVKHLNLLPSARNMVRLAYKSYKVGDFKDIAYFEPYYLKDFVSTTKKRNLLEIVKKR